MRMINIFERDGRRRPSVAAAVALAGLVGFFLLPLGNGSAVAQAEPAEVASELVDPDVPIDVTAGFENPLAVGRVTWSWGPGHRDPFTHEEVFHRGIDVAAAPGTQVVSPADGVVRIATEAYEPSPESGTVVLIDHADGITTFYAHLGSLTVAAGERVARGEVIATVGSTGKSTGPHLHFEVRRDGEAVNPAEFVEEWKGNP